MVRNKSNTLNVNYNKRNSSGRDNSKNDKSNNQNDRFFEKDNSNNNSIIEKNTEEGFEENSEDNIQPGIKKRHTKILNHIENNSHEIKSDILRKVSYKIPKLSFKMKCK